MMSLYYCFCFLVLLVHVTHATITVLSTGRRFSSRPDRFVGGSFMEGYEYMARLQQLDSDSYLCPRLTPGPPLNLTVTVPTDGLPVALVVRSGRCSTETKARLAMFNIQPPNTVKYLIVMEELHRRNYYHDSDESHDDVNRQRDHDIKLGVLHVSHMAGNELLRSVATIDRDLGGPRVILDGRDDARSKFLKRFMLWFGITVMLMGCVLSFVLSITTQRGMVNWTDETANQAQPPRRDPRRRLTEEQVNELLPEFLYADMIADEENHTSVESGELCSICLDEYMPTDRCSCLPCQHAFHSNCISKWLTERSSTCPLCKTDLYISDDEDSSVESGDDDYVALQDNDDDIAGERTSFSLTRWLRQRWQRQQMSVHNDNVLSEDDGGVSQQPLLEQVELSDEGVAQAAAAAAGDERRPNVVRV